MMKTVMTIAGSDSSGGAGLAADLKTFAALGLHGSCAITAVTSQNTREVRGFLSLPPDVVAGQIEAVFDDMAVAAVKTGMIGDEPIAKAVAAALSKVGAENIVVDPVMASTSGAELLMGRAADIIARHLLPVAFAATPNAPEAEALCGFKVDSVETMKEAARKISGLGPGNVVVTGGHVASGDVVTDVLLTKDGFEIFERERVKSEAGHGSGCVFSSALAGYLAMDKEIAEAVRLAGEFTARAIAEGFKAGRGPACINPLRF
ncbi:MAG: bifunctional hydroxymethylpyrimidine kinase/phosphomethylpyrimidine kinase [Candidatus Nitrospinota bacterium M3_3B_026]